MPKFKVWSNSEDEAQEVEAQGASDAVEQVCRKEYDSGWSDCFTMWTRDEEGTLRTHSVSVEVRVVFTVR
jgi:hypothetical protein